MEQQRLFASLESHGDSVCLIDRLSGKSLTYAETAVQSDAVFASIPAEMKSGLAFVVMHDSVAAILAYIGAVRRGFAVHLLDPQKSEANAKLIESYQPDVVIDTQSDCPMTLSDVPDLAVHADLCILLSTSGSTGAAKLVKLTHANILANTIAICQYLGLQPTDRGVTSLNPFYSYGMSVLNTHLHVGASVVVGRASIDGPDFWNVVDRFKMTNIAGVPFNFEVLKTTGRDLSLYSSLRFMTQAGGKLAPDLVYHFATEGAKNGFDFFVMYGQTEAGPRMSYLPPDLAAQSPSAIGRAIPGGAFHLRDAEGRQVTSSDVSGELVFSGPSVMRGYANTRADLSYLEDIPELLTGDIARFDDQGLYYIEGRTSRFVKPFGKRISLDVLEQRAKETFPTAVVTGDDQTIVVAIEEATADAQTIAQDFGAFCDLPATTFRIRTGQPIPRLSNGKIDYLALRSETGAAPETSNPVVIFLKEFWRILSGGKSDTKSVFEAFRTTLGSRVKDSSLSFRDLGGDSIAYMQIYLLLEDYVGEVPDAWADMTIAELEQLGVANVV